MLKYQIYYGRGLARGWVNRGELKRPIEEEVSHRQAEYNSGSSITAIRIIDFTTNKTVLEKQFEQIKEIKQEREQTMKYYEKKAQERREQTEQIKSEANSPKERLIELVYKLEEIGNKRAAKSLEQIIEKLEIWQNK